MPRIIHMPSTPEMPAPMQDPHAFGSVIIGFTRPGSPVPQTHDNRATSRKFGIERPIDDTFSIEGPNNFELTLVDSLHAAVRGRGLNTVRRQFQALEQKVMDDPLGADSLDHFKDTDAGRTARVVHPVTGPLADLVPGKRLALKGTGLDPLNAPGRVRRSDLSTQFRVTLEAQRRQEQLAPNGIGGCVEINNVYGILRYSGPDKRTQEWMLMEQVDGEPIPNIQLALATLGRGPNVAFGFEASRDPALAELLYQGPLGRYDAREVERFRDLGTVIGEQLGYSDYDNPFDDLNGNNVLRRETPEGPRYTIIDVQSH